MSLLLSFSYTSEREGGSKREHEVGRDIHNIDSFQRGREKGRGKGREGGRKREREGKRAGKREGKRRYLGEKGGRENGKLIE